MKLLIDEMGPAWIAERLRALGHDAEAVQERLELCGEPDQVIFATAQREKRAILTENVVHFRALARIALHEGDAHHGLVFTSNASWPRSRRTTFARVVKALDGLLSEHRGAAALRNQERWL